VLGIDLLAAMYPADDAADAAARLDDQLYAGPALFAVGWALARWWQARGVQPTAVLGHSTGEYAAACVAGVLDVADAARLVAERARLMATVPAGGVLQISMPAADIVL